MTPRFVLLAALAAALAGATASAQPYAPSRSVAARFGSPTDAEAAARADWAAGDRSRARRLVAIAAAYRELGRPYRFGGTGHEPGGEIDCSSLVQYAFGRAGVRLPRTSREQAAVGWPVPLSLGELVDGDLVFFAVGGPGAPISHVGLYAGGGYFIHATASSGRRVSMSSLAEPRWARWWVAARRVAVGERGG